MAFRLLTVALNVGLHFESFSYFGGLFFSNHGEFSLKNQTILMFHKPSVDVRFHTKFGPDRFIRLDVYRLQTNKQTPNQSIYIYCFREYREGDEYSDA